MELDHPFHYHYLTFILRSEKKREMELKHPFHDHKLTVFLRHEKEEGDGKKKTCFVCGQKILDSSYRCQDCSFYLHKICAELPQHYQRTVRRRGDEKVHNLVMEKCNDWQSCSECHEYSKACIYNCRDSGCGHRVCVCCASREQIVDHNCHEHGLSPILTSAMISCDACCTTHEGRSYMCLKCIFWIHEDCASLPAIIKFREHPHPLILSYSSPLKGSSEEFTCGISKQRLNNKSWRYHCKPCGFYVHPSCPANIECEIVDNIAETSFMMSLPKDEEIDHLFLKFVKQLSEGDNNREIELNKTELNEKFGCELTLKGEEEGRFTNKKCIACLFPISTDPFYSSGSDDDQFRDIFLHEWCAALPSKLQHSGHLHKLTLHGKRENLRCSNCQCASEGSRFRCEVCPNYCLDVRCASLPTVIKHQVHKQHPLYLSENCLGKSQYCVACNRDIDEFSFGCSICEVNLHYTCALLPLEFKHRYDKHPFTLNYRSIKDDEYYCEICEDDINPKWWFYDCKECRQSVCVRCMWEDKKPFPHIPNWVRTYIYETHPHPLHLMRINSTRRCGICRYFICEGDPTGDDCAYRCESKDCNEMFHRQCTKGEVYGILHQELLQLQEEILQLQQELRQRQPLQRQLQKLHRRLQQQQFLKRRLLQQERLLQEERLLLRQPLWEPLMLSLSGLQRRLQRLQRLLWQQQRLQLRLQRRQQEQEHEALQQHEQKTLQLLQETLQLLQEALQQEVLLQEALQQEVLLQ